MASNWSPWVYSAVGSVIKKNNFYQVNVAYILQSATFSGISWYDLSSVQLGLVVSISFSGKSYVPSSVRALERSKVCSLSQTSGSLYGALIGSAVAFKIADWLG